MVTGTPKAGGYRTIATVRERLQPLGIRAGQELIKRFCRLNERSYQEIIGLVGTAKRLNPSLDTVVLPTRLQENQSFAGISETQVREHIFGNTFNLRRLMANMNEATRLASVFTKETSRSQQTQLVNLVDALGIAKQLFRTMGPDATTETVVDRIQAVVNLLNFRNIQIYFPADGGKWERKYSSSPWMMNGHSKYDPAGGGSEPRTTLKSVIEAPGRRFIVDIAEPETFRKQGLVADEHSIVNDLELSKGPSQMIFIKVISPLTGELVAVVQIHNRVQLTEKAAPKRLLPGQETAASRVLTQLEAIFDEAALALAGVRLKEGSQTKPELNELEKRAVLEQGELRVLQGQRVRLYEAPAEKFYTRLNGVINWLRDTILSVYRGTRTAAGKTKPELIKALSLEDEKMNERVIYSRYTALIEGAPGEEHDLLGIVSYNLFDVKVGDHNVGVLKVPEAMIKKEARGRKILVGLTLEIGRRQLLKYWFDNGLFKGFWLALTHGIPIYGTTQSKRAIKDMLRLANLSVRNTVEGRGLTAEQKGIIEHSSAGKATKDGVEPEAYGGRIAIDEEEQGIVVFGGKKEAALNKLLAELGVNGRLHIVGYMTIGVGIKVALELLWTRLFGRRKRS